MRTFTKALGVTAVAALALTGCGRNSDTGTTPGASNGGSAAAGFPANAVIGVALPQKTSENWVLAEQLFKDGLTDGRLQGRRAVRQRSACRRAAEPDLGHGHQGRQGHRRRRHRRLAAGHPAQGRQGRRRDGHRLRPSRQEHRRPSTTTSPTTTSRSASCRARPCSTAWPSKKAERPVQHRALRRLARRRQRAGLLRRRHEGAPAEDRRRHPQGRRPARRTSTRSSRRAGRPRTPRSAWTRSSSANYTSARARRRPVAQRHPGPRDHHLGQGMPASRSRSSPVRTPRSSRSSRSWRVSSTPRSTRTPATSSRRPSPWSPPSRRAQTPTVNDTKSYNNGVKVVPANLLAAGHRDQGERGRGLRERPDAGPAHQVS